MSTYQILFSFAAFWVILLIFFFVALMYGDDDVSEAIEVFMWIALTFTLCYGLVNYPDIAVAMRVMGEG